MRRLVPPLIAAAALAGCTVGPSFRSPAPPNATAPAGFDALSPAVSAAQEPPGDWWRLYRDPVLDRLVQEALAENRDLRVAAANLEEARGLLGESRAGLFPTTDPSFGVTYAKRGTQPGQATGFGGSGKARFVYSAGFDVGYEVDLFGRIRRTIEASKRDLEAEVAARDLVRVSVAAETARAYADACGYGEGIDVARRSVEIARQGFEVVQVQRRAGSVSDYEVVRTQALLDQARAAIPTLEAQRKSALYRLAVLTGQPPERVPPEAAACRRPPRLSQPIPVGDGAALIRRRPDVREAERRVGAAVARIGVSTADLYPTISLGGSVSSTAGTPGGLGASSALAYSLGPLLTWRFPNIAVARARIRQSEARAQASLASFDGVVLTALSEAEQALATYAGQLDRRAALASARDRDADAAHLAQVRYAAGSIGFLELLDVQRTQIADENALASADQLLASDTVTLFKALGGGWQTAPEMAPLPLDRARRP